MPPDLSAAKHATVLTSGFDRNIPGSNRCQTWAAVDGSVNVRLGGFVAILVLPTVLICATPVTSGLITLLAAAIAAANRSSVRYRWLRIT